MAGTITFSPELMAPVLVALSGGVPNASHLATVGFPSGIVQTFVVTADANGDFAIPVMPVGVGSMSVTITVQTTVASGSTTVTGISGITADATPPV